MDNRATPQAEEEFLAAEQILSQLGADQAASLEAREVQAELWHERARRCYRDADFTGAIDLYNRSLEIRRELVDRASREAADANKRLQYVNDLARGYGWRGDAEVDLGKWADAEKSYQESENLRKQLVAEDPANPEYKFHLARSHGNTARFGREQFKLAQAAESFRKAKDLQLALVRENNSVTDYVEDLADTCLSLAGVLQVLNHQDEIEKNLEEARRGFQALSATAPPIAQRGLAKTDILCGQLNKDRNPVQTQELLEKGRSSLIRAGQAALQWEDLYYLGVAEALLAELSGEIQTKRQEARQRVLAALHQAQRKGFHNPDFARKDPAFSKFRDDQRFQAFLDQLKNPAGRGGNHGP
jgi:tetratricopeptide (TPR) repeat protein